MGLEMTGLARPNSPLVWADPADYQPELASFGLVTGTPEQGVDDSFILYAGPESGR